MAILLKLIDNNNNMDEQQQPPPTTTTTTTTTTTEMPNNNNMADLTATTISADDYDELLNYPNEHRNQLTQYIINELQSQNITRGMDRPSIAMVIGGQTDPFSPLIAADPFGAGSGGGQLLNSNQTSSASSMPDGLGNNNNNNNLSLLNGLTNNNPGGSSSIPRPYFGDIFFSFHNVYWPFHCVTCLIICTLGIFANVTNIIVLTRPNMKSAVNVILCAIAFSDLIVNVSNIPYLTHELSDSNYSFAWAIYTLFHAHTTVTAHTISIWLTCVLATWRYCVVCRSQSTNQRNWSVSLAYRVIVVVFILVPIFCIPNYLSFAIIQETTESNGTFHKVGFSQLADTSTFIKTFHFWIFSVLTKLVPCVLLTFFTTALIRKLLSARERRLRLTSHNNTHKSQENGLLAAQKASIPNDKQQQQERKTSAATATNQESCKVHLTNGLLSVPPNATTIQMSNGGGGGGHETATTAMTSFDSNNPVSEMRMLPKSISCEADDQVDSYRSLLEQDCNQPTTTTNGTVPGDDKNNARRNPQGHKYESSEQQQQHSQSSSAQSTDAETTQVSSEPTSSNDDNADLTPQKNAQQPVILNHLIVESCADAKSGNNNKIVSKTSKMYSRHHHQSNSYHDDNNNANCDDKWNLMPYEMSNPEGRSASTCGNGGAATLELYACTTDGNTGVRQQLIPLDTSVSQQNLSSSLTSHHQQKAQNNNSSANSNNNSMRDKRTASELANVGKQPATVGANQRIRSVGSTSLAPFQMVKLQASQRQLSQNETTTRLLIAVMIVFLICESPAGILSILCAILGQEFFDNVYQPMGILTDLLALINSSVNFILYCFMSTQFRVTFYSVVLHCPAPNNPQQQQQHHTVAATQAAATTTKLQNNNGSFRQPKSTRDDY